MEVQNYNKTQDRRQIHAVIPNFQGKFSSLLHLWWFGFFFVMVVGFILLNFGIPPPSVSVTEDQLNWPRLPFFLWLGKPVIRGEPSTALLPQGPEEAVPEHQLGWPSSSSQDTEKIPSAFGLSFHSLFSHLFLIWL